MPFQDVDEAAEADVLRPPSAIERWLRKIFIEDWSLKLLALAITLVLWLAVTGQNKPVTIRTGVQLNFIRPDNMEISNDPPKTVDVLLTGSRNKLEGFSLLNLVATVDVSDQRPGERVVRLTPGRVQMELPEGLRIDSFQPTTIPVHLEPITQRQVEIDVKLEGKPAAGYEVYGFHPTPNNVTVRGPAGPVDGLQKAPTETILIEGRKESFTVSNVAIEVPDHKVDLLSSTVDVTIEIGERREEKSYANVPVRSSQGAPAQPRTANVTLFGPASVIAQLRPEDLKIVLDSAPEGTLQPHLQLPASLKDRIVLRSIKLGQFSLSK